MDVTKKTKTNKYLIVVYATQTSDQNHYRLQQFVIALKISNAFILNY